MAYDHTLPLRATKVGIGTTVARRLAAEGVQTVGELVEFFNGHNYQWINGHLSVLTQNKAGNECIYRQLGARANSPPRVFANSAEHPVAVRGVDYHVRDVNWKAFNGVLDILRNAAAHPNAFPETGPGGVQLPHILPARQRSPSLATAYCGCLTQAECKNFRSYCQWRDQGPGRRLCVPRNVSAARNHAFQGIYPFAGQYRGRSNTLRPGARYVYGWRKPGELPDVTEDEVDDLI